MEPIKLINATRTLATDQDEYGDLDIVDAELGGANYMYSVWEPSATELEALNKGGRVRLGIMGAKHPPVDLAVQDVRAEIVVG